MKAKLLKSNGIVQRYTVNAKSLRERRVYNRSMRAWVLRPGVIPRQSGRRKKTDRTDKGVPSGGYTGPTYVEFWWESDGKQSSPTCGLFFDVAGADEKQARSIAKHALRDMGFHGLKFGDVHFSGTKPARVSVVYDSAMVRHD